MNLRNETNHHRTDIRIKSCKIQNLKREISNIESMLDRNNQTQKNLMSLVNNLRQTKLINQNEYNRSSFTAIDSTKAQHIIKQLDLQLTTEKQAVLDESDDDYSEALSTMTNSSEQQTNRSSTCTYDNLLDRIQHLEQYLRKPYHHCQQSLTISSLNYNNNAQTDLKDNPTNFFPIPSSKDLLSPLSNNLKQPVIMQGHLNNQPVTLLNTSAIELITTLKELHSKHNSLNKSYENVLELLHNRDKQLIEINTILNEYYEQLQTIENLKHVDGTIQNQNWEKMYRSIRHIKSQSLLMSKFTSPKEMHINEHIQRLYEILNTSSSRVQMSPRHDINESVEKEQKLLIKKDTKLMNKNRKKKELPK